MLVARIPIYLFNIQILMMNAMVLMAKRLSAKSIRLERGHLLLSLLLFLGSQTLLAVPYQPQSFGYAMTTSNGRIELPFVSIHNLIVVPVSINGSIPFNFILDCGISHTIVTEPSLTGIMQLKPEREINILGAGGEHQVKAFVCTGNLIQLPGVKGEGIPVVLLQEDYLSLSALLGIPIFGLLGSDLFRDLVINIDYVERKLRIEDPARFRIPHGYLKVPVRLQAGKPHFVVGIEQSDGQAFDIEVLADLGASHFLLLETNTDERLKIPEKHLPSHVGFGLAGPIQGSFARANAVRIAKNRLVNPIVAYTSNYGPEESQGQRNGSVGGEFMCRFHVIFDLSRETMYLQKNQQFHRRYSQDKSGLGIMAGGDRLDQILVFDVRENSPAWEAGIRTGDRVVKLNGARVQGLDRMNTMMRQRDGKRIFLKMEREGKPYEARFRLAPGL